MGGVEPLERLRLLRMEGARRQAERVFSAGFLLGGAVGVAVGVVIGQLLFQLGG